MAIIDISVIASADDAEEKESGTTYPNSSDLELVDDGGDLQKVGIRFVNVTIPNAATITNAYLQFTAKDATSGTIDLNIVGEDEDDTVTYSTGTNIISGRNYTTANVDWEPAAWAASAAGVDQRTSDLSTVVQEIVDRTGWSSGNAMAFMITGTVGVRRAQAYDFSSGTAPPELHVEYSTSQDLAPTGIASAEAFGTAVVATSGEVQYITTTGIASAEAFGTTGIIGGDREYFFDGDTTENAKITLPNITLSGDFTITATVRTADLANPPDGLGVTIFGDTANASWVRLNPDGSITFKLAGVSEASIAGVYPSDNAEYSLKLRRVAELLTYSIDDSVLDSDDVSTSDITFTHLGQKADTSEMRGVIKDVSIVGTIASNAVDLFWPINDGWAGDPAILETNVGGGTWDGTAVGFKEANWEPFIIPSGISSAEAFGAVIVDIEGVFPTGIASSEAFGTGSVSIVVSLDRRISAGSDDAEEATDTGNVTLTSSDIELVYDLNILHNQEVGLRFTDIAIPGTAVITSAYIQFKVDETSAGSTVLNIAGEKILNAPTFTTTNSNISDRTPTTASVGWEPVEWDTVGEAGLDQRTPELKTIVQEIIDQGSWAVGNALAFIITGTGTRIAEAYDGDSAGAALLHLEYTSEAFNKYVTPTSIASAEKFGDTLVLDDSAYLRVPSDYATIELALAAAQAGDIILIYPGEYFVAAQLLVEIENLTIASLYLTTGDEDYIDSTVVSSGITTRLFEGSEGLSANFSIIGLTIEDAEKPVIFTEGDCLLDHCIIRNAYGDSISFDANGGGEVSYCKVYDSGDDALDIDTRYDGSFHIHHNEFHDSGDDSIEIHFYENVSTTHMYYDIHDNLLDGAGEDGMQIIDYESDTNRSLDFYNNVVANMPDVGFGTMWNVTGEDFQGSPMGERVRIFNNYFYNNDHHITGGDNMIILNNIFDTSVVGVKRVKTDSIVDYNLFYNNTTNVTDSITGSNNIYDEDPQSNADFTLQAGSPAIDAGIANYVHNSEEVLDIPAEDYYGSAPDMGYAETEGALPLPAFPGAEGPGAVSVGGRGGTVIEVTNLNSSGTGSFRAACEASGARTVIFKVAGVIDITGSEIRIENPYITIAGQTAPEGGITIKGNEIDVRTHNVIMRFIKIRVGGDIIHEVDDLDSVSMNNDQVYNCIVDHVSASWANDEIMQIWNTTVSAAPHDITYSWCIISEGIEGHSTGFITGSYENTVDFKDVSLHNNLMSSTSHRLPLIKTYNAVVANNLIYNWRGWCTGIKGGCLLDVVANKYKPGPETSSSQYYEVNVEDSETGELGYGEPDFPRSGAPGWASIYVSGNIGPNQSSETGDNWPIVFARSSITGEYWPLPSDPFERTTPQTPYTHRITVRPIATMETEVLQDAGASRRIDENGAWVANRDEVDDRLVSDYENGTGFIPLHEDEVGGYPEFDPATGYTDTNGSGMSDLWEAAYGLDVDPETVVNADGYTNLEAFINGSNPIGGLIPVGVTSGEAFGLADVSIGSLVTTGIASAEAFGTPSLVDGISVDVSVSAGSDDAEERPSGTVYPFSSDLEMVDDNGIQTVGIRFLGAAIPDSATLVRAYIQFKVKAATSVATSLNIAGEKVDSATTFIEVTNDITDRTTTTASADWDPVAWNSVDAAGVDQQTSDLSAVIQEIVDQAGWTSGNPLAFIITGTGVRNAYSYDGNPGGAPALHIEYTVESTEIEPTGIASAEAFGTSVVTTSAVDIAPTGVASAEAFGTSVVTSTVDIATTGIAGAEAFGTSVVTVGDAKVTPAGIASAEAFGTGVLTLGGVSVLPAGVASAEAFGTAAIGTAAPYDGEYFFDGDTAENAKVTLPGITLVGDFTIYATVRTADIANPPDGIGVTIFGDASNASWVRIAPSGGITFKVAGASEASATGIYPTDNDWHDLKITRVSDVISYIIDDVTEDTDIASTGNVIFDRLGQKADTSEMEGVIKDVGIIGTIDSNAVDLFWSINDGWAEDPTISETNVGGGTWDGTAVAFKEVNWKPFLAPGGLASAEAFGTALVETEDIDLDIAPDGIASAEAFGTSVVTTGAVEIAPDGIASAEAFGTSVVTTGAVEISPDGIASTEAFGTSVVTSTVDMLPDGITSAEAFGTSVVTTGAVEISPDGIASAEAFGTATVSNGNIAPTGIASAEAFGTHIVSLVSITKAGKFGKKFYAHDEHKTKSNALGRMEQENEEILAIIEIIGALLL